jgi:hypothetical protein
MNKSIAILVVATLIAGAAYLSSNDTQDTLWEEWKANHGANWSPSE